MEFGSLRRRVMVLLISICLYPLISEAKAYTAKQPKIAIVGAGMAGIALAERLKELGYNNMVILEGGTRIGGRMLDVQVGNYTLQQGANWIQSLGTNPVFRMAKKYDLKYKKTDYEDFVTYDQDGKDITKQSKKVDDEFWKVYKKTDKLAREMEANKEVDATYRSGTVRNGWTPRTRLQDLIEYYTVDFEFAYPAEGNSLIESVYKTYDIHGNDDDANVIDQRGYAYIASRMLDEIKGRGVLKLYFNKYVTKIKQTADGVVIKAKNGKPYFADYVVVTSSIGVLQNRLIDFVPKLPKWKLDAIDQIQMALYYNIFFQFPYKFWDDNQFMIYCSEQRGYYPIFQNMNKLFPYSNILHITVTGDEAKRVHRIPRQQVKKEVMAILNKLYGKRCKGGRVPEPLHYEVPQLFTDPLFMGSYSNVPPGYTGERQANLTKPFGRVYFAGEANAGPHSGYVHGAWYSGRETAELLHSNIRNNYY